MLFRASCSKLNPFSFFFLHRFSQAMGYVHSCLLSLVFSIILFQTAKAAAMALVNAFKLQRARGPATDADYYSKGKQPEANSSGMTSVSETLVFENSGLQ
jgi:hypothetical protein